MGRSSHLGSQYHLAEQLRTYDMDSVNNKLSTITGIAKAFGNDTSKVEKVVELKFDGDVMKSYAVVDAASAG